MSVVSRLRSQRLDTGAAVLGLLGALVLFPLRFVASQIYIQTIPIMLGVACILYLVAVRSDHDWETLPSLPQPVARLLPSATIVVTAGMVLAAGVAGQRSPVFFDLATVGATLLLAQPVLAADEDFNHRLFLAEVVIFALVIRFAALLTTPGLIGIDVWTHITFLADAIKEQGTLAAIDGNKYYTSPFYHLLVVAASLLYDVPLREALFLSLGVTMPAASMLVYATGRMLLESRWAALAAAVYSLSGYVVQWGLHLIPTSMGVLLFTLVLYFLVRYTRTKRTKDLAALVAATVAVVVTHQVSSFIMLVLVGAGLLAGLVFYVPLVRPSRFDSRTFSTERPVSMAGVLVFDMGLLVLIWSITPLKDGTFLSVVLGRFQDTLVSSAGFLNLASPSSTDAASSAAASGPTLIETLATYVDTTGFLLLLGGTFLGCLYVVHRKRAHQATFTLLLASAVMLVFALGLPLFGIRNFIPGRWFAFMYAPMALLTAVGLRYLARSIDRRVFVAVVLIFALTFPVMLLSSHATIDNPTFDDQWEQLSYTPTELAAVDAVGRMTGSPGPSDIRPNEVLFTDHPYKTVFRRSGAYPSDTAVLGRTNRTTHPLVVYRHKQSTQATFFNDGHGNGVIRDAEKSRICRPSQSVLYANGDVSVCLDRSAASGA